VPDSAGRLAPSGVAPPDHTAEGQCRASRSHPRRTGFAPKAGPRRTLPASRSSPGLARYDEVAAGRIDHALRFTVSRTRRAYVWPARHYASSLTDPSLPPMGLRLRLKAAYDISGFPRQARVVLRALKEYGMMVADNGSSWYLTGAPDSRWSNDDLRTLRNVPAQRSRSSTRRRCARTRVHGNSAIEPPR
jgi:hypothetical protein